MIPSARDANIDSNGSYNTSIMKAAKKHEILYESYQKFKYENLSFMIDKNV